jgi:hypothetical protein
VKCDFRKRSDNSRANGKTAAALISTLNNLISQTMENNLQAIFAEKNAMVKQGQVVEATDKFFADNATTSDHTGAKTKNKAEMMEKMHGFAGSIKAVNGITLHNEALNGNVSFAEFTFDFDMQDGSKVLWHEILRTVWQDGLIVDEQYFTA